MLQEILWKNQNKKQVFGAALGSLVGLLLLLFALQTYLEFNNILNGSGNESGNFVLINKKVNLLNTFGVKNAFTEEEIQDIQSQSFIRNVGQFTPNQFKVSASSSTLGFYTELFFESVPDDFLDFDASEFTWRPGQNEIPIVMSRDYLALYNFGFAPSQGLPQFTQGTIKKVSFTITLQGNGLSKQFRGRIVDFSDRINTILVPNDFMDWANQQLGGNSYQSASRLILDCTNPNSADVAAYFKKKGYEVSSGKLIGARLQTAIQLTFGIIAGLGILIFFLSLLIFILNFQLLISRSKEKIELLLQLGYKPKAISQALIRKLTGWFTGIFLVTIIGFIAAWYFIAGTLQAQGYAAGRWPDGLVWFAIAIFALSFFILNYVTIQKHISKLAS